MKVEIVARDKGFLVIFGRNPPAHYPVVIGTIQRRQHKPKHVIGKPIAWDYFWRVRMDKETYHMDFLDLEEAKAYAIAVASLTD